MQQYMSKDLSKYPMLHGGGGGGGWGKGEVEGEKEREPWFILLFNNILKVEIYDAMFSNTEPSLPVIPVQSTYDYWKGDY